MMPQLGFREFGDLVSKPMHELYSQCSYELNVFPVLCCGLNANAILFSLISDFSPYSSTLPTKPRQEFEEEITPLGFSSHGSPCLIFTQLCLHVPKELEYLMGKVLHKKFHNSGSFHHRSSNCSVIIFSSFALPPVYDMGLFRTILTVLWNTGI
ncbi:hypothetical protein VNO77_31708 [Canavalia gladiata]|uniref:Uncharacterized protein n=1 Tax=Canavalia gladiata TaxID=3824 RepID=A0AAN9KR74_CANGL